MVLSNLRRRNFSHLVSFALDRVCLAKPTKPNKSSTDHLAGDAREAKFRTTFGATLIWNCTPGIRNRHLASARST